MSLPISDCLVMRAAVDEKAYQYLLRALKESRKGSLLMLPCDHNPRCKKLDDEVLDKLAERLAKDIISSLPKKV